MNTTLYLIRHCQTTGQEPDAVLTTEGEQQAENLMEFLSKAPVARIVSSPFVRAVQSVTLLAHRLGAPIETDPRLQERVLSDRSLPNWREQLRQTFEYLDLRLPGGETSREAMQRASAAVQDILRTPLTGAVAVVSHGNLSTLLLKLFDDTLGFSTWERMTTPDVFCLHIGETGTCITRLWQANN